MPFTVDNTIYESSMIISYINLFKPPKTSIKMSSKIIQDNLIKKEWFTPKYKNGISVLDVIQNKKKHKEHYERMLDAELKYPIIIWKEKNLIIDGNHRIGAALIRDKKTIKAYELTTAQMKKFAIVKFTNEEDYWEKYNSLNTNNYIELFYKRFCKK